MMIPRKVTVTEAETMFRDDLDQMRRDYTRMRDIAHKRMQRMSKTEFTETETYKKWGTNIPRLRDMDVRDLPKLYSELSKFVNSRLSTVSGQRRAKAFTTRTLNAAIGAESGTGVTNKNYWRVIDILNEARRKKITYGSDKIVDLAETTMGLSKDQFNDMLDQLDKALAHPEKFTGGMDAYMKNHDIKDYQEVDMTDAIKEIWGK